MQQRPQTLATERPLGGAITVGASCDLLLLALPEGRGLEIWKEIRCNYALNDLSATILTVQNQEIVRILDCSKGDNCLKKLDQAESVTQLKSLPHVVQSSDIHNGPLETEEFVIDPISYRVTHAGKQSTLPVLEFRLLYYLAARPNRFFTRNQLHAEVWGDSRSANPRVVDVYIRRLRLRIEADPHHPVHLKTLRGMGYLFDSAPRTLAVKRNFS